MAENTKIEWTDSTWNPWIGCGKVSPGCDNCYAEVSTPARTMKVIWAVTGERTRTSVQNWNLPKRWEAKHEEFFAKHGRRQRVFCASLADVFDKAAPAEWRIDLWNLIDATPHLDWLLLTKRIGNVERMVPLKWLQPGGWPKNVRIGISVVNQEEADRDIPKLVALGCPNFLSMEPLLGPVSLRWLAAFPENAPTTAQHPSGNTDHLDGLRRINWVIVGGESGAKARPMSREWARTLRDQCEAAGVPFLFKQWGEWAPGATFPDYIPAGMSEAFEKGDSDDERAWKVGKKAAGRELDGRTWDGYPA